MSLDAYAAMAQARANEVETFTAADGLDVQAYAEHLRQRDREFQEEVRDTARLAARELDCRG